MRKFQVSVNGNTYEVEVEELQGGQSVTPAAAAPSVVPKAAPSKPAAAPKTASTSAPSGATTITAPMPGTILDIKVSQGQQVSEGDVVAVLEAMKMENEIVASTSGTISSVNVSKGASVESGDVIVSIG